MTPTNTAKTPEIENIADNQGNKHTVVPTPHEHDMQEVDGLTNELSSISTALNRKAPATHSHDSIGGTEAGASVSCQQGAVKITIGDSYASVNAQNIQNLDRAMVDPATTPENSAGKLITSKAVYDGLAGKMANKTIDSEPANNTDHLVSSKGVYDAIDGLRQDTEHYLEGKQDALTFDTTPTANSTNPVTSGGVKAAINEVNEKIDNKHALEYEDETYLSRMGVGQLNCGDDELDGAFVYGKDAIRFGVLGGSVFIDSENIANLQCALLGLEINFVRNENGDYAIDSDLKEYLNDLLEGMPADKCVPCLVRAQWWNGSSYVGGYFPGALCHHSYTTPGIPRTIYLSFLGNLFHATRTANNDFPNAWTKFENPFATV